MPETTPNEEMLKILTTLSDPKAAKERLEEITAAQKKLVEEEKKFKDTQKSVKIAHDEAQSLYKKAAQERLEVERKAKEATEKLAKVQRTLDEINIKEAGVNALATASEKKAADLDKREAEASRLQQQLKERDEGLAKKTKEVEALKAELTTKLNKLREIAA